MRLEYFQLIDRILDISIEERTIRTEATVPAESTIFEGHFPGYPLMPGALLIETMAQTSGWLIIALTKFTRMPFFAAVNEAKLRTFVTPGQALSATAQLTHDGSGFARTQAQAASARQSCCRAWSWSAREAAASAMRGWTCMSRPASTRPQKRKPSSTSG